HHPAELRRKARGRTMTQMNSICIQKEHRAEHLRNVFFEKAQQLSHRLPKRNTSRDPLKDPILPQRQKHHALTLWVQLGETLWSLLSGKLRTRESLARKLLEHRIRAIGRRIRCNSSHSFYPSTSL